VGLGKTHLLHAIGNEFLKRNPSKSIRYVASDEFVREVYNALSSGNNNIETLKDKYQNADLLLIDDIQFLAKKDKINEIFFNIFNHNIKNGQIIVMTSDKPPSLLDNFEDRMKSRFASGLMIKINKPDLASIQKILEEKIKEANENFLFTKEAIAYVAHRNSNDVRHLEGYLHRILFYAINNLPPQAVINVDTIKNSIEVENLEKIGDLGYDVNPDIVISQICAAYSINKDLVKSKIRTKQSSLVRHVCMYVLRTKFNMPFDQIGSYFNGRSHSTVIESVEKIQNKIKKDPSLKEFIENLFKKI
jgi:chromosomal replication initiator protein